MARLDELLQDGWRPQPREVVRLLRDVGSELTRLHRGGAVHGGISPASVERTADGGFRLCPADAAGRDPWLVEPPEVVDGDAPTVQSDAYEFAATTEQVVRSVEWEVPKAVVVAVQRALRENPGARPSVTAFVVCATEELVEHQDEDEDEHEGKGKHEHVEEGGAATGEAIEGEEPGAGPEPPTDPLPAVDGPGDREGQGVAGDQDAQRIAALRESLRAAAAEPPRRGLQGAGRPRGRLLAVGAAALLLTGGLWWAGRPGPEPMATQVPAAEGTVAAGEQAIPSAAEPSSPPSTSPPPSPGVTEDGQGPSLASGPMPAAEDVEALLDARAAAWAEGDEEALAEAVVPGSPAWERDSATGPGGGEVELPSYRVSDLQAVPGKGASGLVLTASVAQGSDSDPVSVRLVLEAADDAGAGRLVDWTVLSAAEDAPSGG
ncbi:hypothetical protein [Kytococcus sedentarius]|uniref:hypothetical protein n=1 Tax=Kytococcus sedentarius TaxID=1276 RepID=UPI00384C4F77